METTICLEDEASNDKKESDNRLSEVQFFFAHDNLSQSWECRNWLEATIVVLKRNTSSSH